MAEPTTTATATAATTAGFTLLGFLAGLHQDLIISGLVGGVAAILTMESMTVKQRLAAVTVAIMVAGLIGPLVVNAAPRAFPDLLRAADVGPLRLAVGFILGALAYKVLLPVLIRRAKRTLDGEK